MATEIEFQIIESQTVKPSSPTPENCRRYELSSMDQVSPNVYISVLLFYPSTTHVMSISGTSQHLITSLCQTLTRFYHLAGRLRNNVFIECSDDGADFMAAKSNCPMSKILENPALDTLTNFVPHKTFLKEARDSSPLLLVKANFFDCGGLAIGVSLSHKAGDASTLSTFLNSWAAQTSQHELGRPELIPQFISSTSIFPPMESLAYLLEPSKVPAENEKIKSKRLVFHGPRIEALRSKAATDSTVRNPTRVEAVSALIWKCSIEASSLRGCDSLFTHVVNIRKRMNPCLAENSVGNLLGLFQAKRRSGSEAEKTELKDLVALLRNGVEEFKTIWKEGTPPEGLSGSVKEMLTKRLVDSGFHQFAASSWCRFPLYGVDFGWGKPSWICVPMTRGKNFCIMMDTRDGKGIEVSLGLCEEEMKHFETNPELLDFAYLDPAVVI